MDNKHELVKNGLDVASGFLAFSAVANIFDPIFTCIVSLLAIWWYSLRIWEYYKAKKLAKGAENG